jgi:hypothetical protein
MIMVFVSFMSFLKILTAQHLRLFFRLEIVFYLVFLDSDVDNMYC